jgi:hypothetical protein
MKLNLVCLRQQTKMFANKPRGQSVRTKVIILMKSVTIKLYLILPICYFVKGNVAGDSVQCRDYVLSLAALSALTNVRHSFSLNQMHINSVIIIIL